MKQKQNDIQKLTKALQSQGLSKQEYIRIQAVLLKKKGYSLKAIMDITQKAQVTIQGWITDYHTYSLDGLKTKKRAVAPRAKLTNEQKNRIKLLITGHKPKEKGYSGDFWSVPTLKQLVKDEYGVIYKSQKAYRDLLHYCDFSYQKAEYIDRRKDDGHKQHFRKYFKKKLKTGTISISW